MKSRRRVADRRPAVSPEDEALFLEAVGGTTPLSARDRIPVPPRPPSPVRIVELPAVVALTIEGDGRRYAARAPGVSRTQIAELRAGKVHVEQTLDLHGHTVAAGLQELREFLLTAHRIGRRCVLVIHGKGLHGGGVAILRDLVVAQLVGPLSGLVHAFAPAAPSDGGAGATYVMVRG